MNIKRVYIVWTCITTVTFGLSPPQNINIIIKDNNVIFTWTLPSEPVTETYLEVYDESDTGIQESISVEIPHTNSSYTLSDIMPCRKYTVKLQSGNESLRSEVVEKTFWTTDNVFTADIYTDVNLTWTTGLSEFYQVDAPSRTTYTVQGGTITENSHKSQYRIYIVNHNIHVSVLNVTQNDGGLYKSESVQKSHNAANGCCLLIVTDKPTKPYLTYEMDPYVGYPTVFTCSSEVQRWPAELSSSLSYTFPAIGEQHNNMLNISMTELDNEKRIYCRATDDLGKVSDPSDVIIIDSFYNYTSHIPADHEMSVDSIVVIICSSVAALLVISIIVGIIRNRRNSNSVDDHEDTTETGNLGYIVVDRSNIQEDNYSELAATTNTNDMASNDNQE